MKVRLGSPAWRNLYCMPATAIGVGVQQRRNIRGSVGLRGGSRERGCRGVHVTPGTDYLPLAWYQCVFHAAKVVLSSDRAIEPHERQEKVRCGAFPALVCTLTKFELERVRLT